MALKKKSKISATFSMSSMTDIVFLLLIFFMITSTLVHPNAIKLIIPRASTKKVEVDKFLQVRVSSGGSFYVSGKRVAESQIESYLQNYFSRNQKTIIKLQTDANAKTGKVAQVLDIAESNKVKVALDIR